MIEIVAKAIYDDNRGITMDLARNLAKVAITAMREPNDGMIERGSDIVYDGREWDKQISAAEIYTTMIDAALK